MLRFTIITVLFLLSYLPPIQAAEYSSPAIVINLPSRTLEYYGNNGLIKEYSVAIGSTSTPTPVGTFSISVKEVNPAWYPPGKKYFIPSGPGNPLGYRWMGFLPTYGIHGTNMPWSIGGVLSNGCIRMLEEDAEELFEIVPIGTPVYITYDRVKTRIEDQGLASIVIYPDVYGYRPISVKNIQDDLSALGFDGLAEDVFLSLLLAQQSEQYNVFAQVFSLEVNGMPLTKYGFWFNSIPYIPAIAVASTLSVSLEWDEYKCLVKNNAAIVPGLRKGNTVYVTADDLSLLLGGLQLWDRSHNCLRLQLPTLFFDDQPMGYPLQTIAASKLVPVLPLAQLLKQRIVWNESTQIMTNSIRRLPIIIIDKLPYMDTQNLGQFFNVQSQWDEQQQVMTLSYPAYPSDISMYLDLMGDFFD